MIHFYDDDYCYIRPDKPSDLKDRQEKFAKSSQQDFSCKVCSKTLVHSHYTSVVINIDGFFCSRTCYSKFKASQPKIPNKEDVKIVKEKLTRRHKILNQIDDIKNKIETLQREMYRKEILISSAPYKGKWMILESHWKFGYPNVYGWKLSEVGLEINPEYVLEYNELLNKNDTLADELNHIEKYLVSGKCVRYDRA